MRIKLATDVRHVPMNTHYLIHLFRMNTNVSYAVRCTLESTCGSIYVVCMLICIQHRLVNWRDWRNSKRWSRSNAPNVNGMDFMKTVFGNIWSRITATSQRYTQSVSFESNHVCRRSALCVREATQNNDFVNTPTTETTCTMCMVCQLTRMRNYISTICRHSNLHC